MDIKRRTVTVSTIFLITILIAAPCFSDNWDTSTPGQVTTSGNVGIIDEDNSKLLTVGLGRITANGSISEGEGCFSAIGRNVGIQKPQSIPYDSLGLAYERNPQTMQDCQNA